MFTTRKHGVPCFFYIDDCLLVSELHQVSLDESIDLAVHDALDIAGLEACAMILDTLVVEDIRADL